MSRARDLTNFSVQDSRLSNVDSDYIEPLLTPIHISGSVAMIGRTSSSSSTAGAQFSSDGNNIVRDGQSALTIKRLTSNGDMITLAKDGDVVGSIGGIKTSSGGRTYLSGLTTHSIYVNGGSANVNPGTATGSDNDNAIDLGASYARWKNLYLSGGAYLGGTVSANYLDDYEEGTFSPTLKNEGDTNLSTTKTSSNVGSYVKIGTSVQFQIIISISAVSGGSGQNLIVDNMPFVAKSIYTNGYGGAVVTYTAWNTTDPKVAVVLHGSDNLRLYTGALQPALSNQLSSSTYIVLHGQYETAS